MSPLAKSLNILQAETDVQMGWLLPTLTLLISKLDRVRTTSRYCKPLVDALQEGLQQRFGNMFVEPEFIAAAILVPKFKTSWTLDENIVKLGLDYIKDHLVEETLNQLPFDGSSASEEEDFFASIMSTHGAEGIKQFDGYLACKDDHKDILKSFPSVCRLSLKVNTALPASAACERLFSTAGLIFSPRRARIDSKNFENQLLLKLNKKYCHFS
ncbi:transposase [Triplophysa rosa]|nr:transposase [Triplophysa rosa]